MTSFDGLREDSGPAGRIQYSLVRILTDEGMNWEPHAYGGTMYQMANLHVILAVRNCALFELPIHHGEVGCWDVGTTDVIRIDERGDVRGPTKPGLGLDVDWEQVQGGHELEV